MNFSEDTGKFTESLGNFVDDLRKELYESDGIEWFAQDPIYEHLADGFPTMTKEIVYRDVAYPVITEYVINSIRRLEVEGKNQTKNIKEWTLNFIEGMAQKSLALEDELTKAHEQGKTKKQLINLVLNNLKKTREPGSRKQKYIPLIENSEDCIILSAYARELFNPEIIKKYGSGWTDIAKSIRAYERQQMGLPLVEEPNF